MSCNDYVTKIGPYVDGELPRGEREEIEEHIALCPACRRMATEFTTLDRIAGRGDLPRITAIEWAETMSKVRRRAREGSMAGPAWGRGYLAAAASLAAALLIALVLSLGDGPGPADEGSGPTIAGPEETTDPSPTEPRVAEGTEEDSEEVSGKKETSDAGSDSPRF